MIVNHSDGLQMTVGDYRPDVLESPFPQVARHLVAQAVTHTCFILMRRIDLGLAFGKAPNVIVECSELLSHLDEGSRIGNHALNLASTPYHVFRIHYPLHVVGGESCHLLIVEIGKARSENLTFLQHQQP